MKRIGFLLLYFLSPLGLVAAIVSQNPERYSQLSGAMPMFLGVFGYTWLLWQFVMSARPRFIEKHFGLDKLYRFHGIMALVAILGVVLHKIISEQLFGETPMTKLGELALIIFVGISALSLVLMTNMLVRHVPMLAKPIAQLKSWRILSYEWLKGLHNLTIVALIMMQVHVLMTTSAKSSLLVFNVYMIYFSLSIGAFLYHKALKPWLLSSRLYVIEEVHSEAAPGVYTLVLSASNGRPLRYQPGQFAYFTLLSDTLPPETHPFSFSSAPIETVATGRIQVTIKALGDFTQRLPMLKPGDGALIEGPYGAFSYRRYPKEQQSIFIAGGVGITPMLSMLKELAHTDPKRKVTLLWGIRTSGDIVQQEHLKEIEKAMPNLHLLPVVSNDSSWPGEQGYIDGALLSRVISDHGVRGTGFYLCGPPPMMASAESVLQDMGISKKQIHKEAFL